MKGDEAKRSKKFPTQAATISSDKIISQAPCAARAKDMPPGERGERFCHNPQPAVMSTQLDKH